MSAQERVERYQAFESELVDLLGRYKDILGPRYCAVCGRGAEHCEHSVDDGTSAPIEDTFVSGWLLIHQWQSMSELSGFWDWEAPSTGLVSHSLGLATAALDDLRAQASKRA